MAQKKDEEKQKRTRRITGRKRPSLDIDLDMYGSPKMRTTPLPGDYGRMPWVGMLPRAQRRLDRARARRDRQDLAVIRAATTQRSKKAS